ncbi:DeoR/GlpR family DNA-binding transcription regulator [Extibacter muris]|uniref:DeoR/GlpR transcriptional regulator n=1 Tax=Extibacter muris TaxID=1796622 RepID=A0A4V2WS71_9FIRM|nr:DeoR/GlpR family DNA-binding transcription regulator [Extibacter muris]MCU0081015.1 DeoR/GlpR family DNA-binding transcription regulator [Extibacter muris]TDA20460.1 DeoR/GlpR transcriptional regulator [Extibacter muris]
MKKERHARIIELLENHMVCTPKELSEELACSEMTIRRDLNELEEMNLVRRKHGCAFLVKAAKPNYFLEQIDEQQYEKEAIAKAALQFVHPYSVICIDSGTTAHTVSRFLPDNIPLSVITSNLMTAVELSEKENIQTYVIGGMLYHRTKSIMTESPELLTQHPADVAFISARAFRIPGGAFEHTYPLVATKKALVSIARKTVLLIDHTKAEHVSLCNSIPLNQIDAIITDNKTSTEILKKAVGLKKEVIVVNPETAAIEHHYNKM